MEWLYAEVNHSRDVYTDSGLKALLAFCICEGVVDRHSSNSCLRLCTVESAMLHLCGHVAEESP